VFASVLTAIAATAFRAPSAPSPLRSHIDRRRPLQSQLDGHEDMPNESRVFLLSLDGTLLSSSRTKSRIAIQAAFKVWPSLLTTAIDLNLNPNSLEDETWNWLVEKLSALSSITQQGDTPDKMLGCDSVFLARVLLEEQLLDGGRSNGRGGKYGGKYHPCWTSDFDSDGSVVGSRPLTVGELYANWGDLREVMDFKYPVVVDNRKMDPMPRIRQVLKETMSAKQFERDQLWQQLAYDLFENRQPQRSNEVYQNSILLLGHEAQLHLALASFASLTVPFTFDFDLDCETSSFGEWLENEVMDDETTTITITSSQNAHSRFMERSSNRSILLVVPNPHKEETQSEMIQKILHDFDSNNSAIDETDISVVHSSLDVLKRCKSFLEEDP
jgi:hypothetical protein